MGIFIFALTTAATLLCGLIILGLTNKDIWFPRAALDLMNERGYICTNAFIDVGANNGVAVKEFVNIGKPVNKSGPFRKFLSNKPWNPLDFCIFGFEGNPIFDTELKELETELRAQGFPHVELRTQTVVAVNETDTILYLDSNTPEYNYWGSSLLRGHYAAKSNKYESTPVKAVNLGKFVLPRIDPSGILLVKMDIEGAEYFVLADLLSSGVMCHRNAAGDLLFDYFNVEMHPTSTVDIKGQKKDMPTNEGLSNSLKFMMRECGVNVDYKTD